MKHKDKKIKGHSNFGGSTFSQTQAIAQSQVEPYVLAEQAGIIAAQQNPFIAEKPFDEVDTIRTILNHFVPMQFPTLWANAEGDPVIVSEADLVANPDVSDYVTDVYAAIVDTLESKNIPINQNTILQYKNEILDNLKAQVQDMSSSSNSNRAGSEETVKTTASKSGADCASCAKVKQQQTIIFILVVIIICLFIFKR